jgi:AraC family transcriptional regulator
MMLALKWELQCGYPNGRLYGQSAIVAIVSHALPQYGTIRPVLKSYHRGLGTTRLRRVLEYIDAYIGRDLGIPELASVADLSQYHFAKLFRISMGRTIHQYVLDRRVDAACRLIDRGRLSLAGIGAEVGLHNPCHFATAFRRRLGLTPREYKRARTGVR